MEIATNLPIAVFDSGVGGLTVVRALRQLLPHEAIVYLGDAARLPYGDKSPDVVKRYATACSQFLLKQKVKLLVVACNTASAYALPHLRQTLAVPVLGVIEPGARLAASLSRGGLIGVIATHGTVQSGSYQSALADFVDPSRVAAVACPLFVPLAEENMVHHPATRLIAEEYLAPLLARDIDTLVLGCTHYPLLEPLLADLCGQNVRIIDSAKAVAVVVADTLHKLGLLAKSRESDDRFFATDAGQRRNTIGAAFLGDTLTDLQWVDISA